MRAGTAADRRKHYHCDEPLPERQAWHIGPSGQFWPVFTKGNAATTRTGAPQAEAAVGRKSRILIIGGLPLGPLRRTKKRTAPAPAPRLADFFAAGFLLTAGFFGAAFFLARTFFFEGPFF